MEILDILKVSSKSSPKSVAGAITAITREKRPVELQAVGAGAVNQAAKAIAIARSNLALFGIDRHFCFRLHHSSFSFLPPVFTDKTGACTA